ncbi:hypothetical protein DL89DRAFT_270212, partial [Linderina pennispora]
KIISDWQVGTYVWSCQCPLVLLNRVLAPAKMPWVRHDVNGGTQTAADAAASKRNPTCLSHLSSAPPPTHTLATDNQAMPALAVPLSVLRALKLQIAPHTHIPISWMHAKVWILQCFRSLLFSEAK